MLVIAGAIGGFLAGLLGIGGGPVYALIFLEFIGILYGDKVSEAEKIVLVVSNTNFAKIFAGLAGCWQQYKLNNFYLRPVLNIALSGSIVAILLTWWLSTINYSEKAFTIIFILLFLPLLYRMFADNKERKNFNQPYRIKILYLHLVGILNGIVTALAGLGGGFVIVPLLNSLFNIKIRKVFSISLGAILVVSIFISIFNVLFFSIETPLPHLYGTISLALSMPVVVGVLIATPLGVKASRRLTPYSLRILFIIFSILIIAKNVFSLI